MGVIRSRLIEIVRAGEWWEYKLVPIFAVFYATALSVDMPVSALWRAALTVLIALVPGAAYVSVINDLTDREDDLAAGKRNRLANAPAWLGALLVLVTAGCGVVIAWLWRHDTLLLTMYLAAWLVYSLYSWPPFRFKTRGLLGVLCDASGSNLFPALVAVLLAYRGAGRPPNTAWLVAVGAWAFFNGIRGILWHQLTDLENDVRTNVRTFAMRHPPSTTIAIGTWIAFPLELVALAGVLWQIRSAWPAAFLAVYALIATRRLRRFHMNAVVVQPKARYLIVLHEYYDVYLPIAILVASALRHPRDFIVLALHGVLFPNRLLQTVRDFARLRRHGW
jgi:4-hydroxybenzoate polyprenyltransferase